jgi:hypothetical protein
MTATEPLPPQPVPSQHRRPTLWIALTVLFGLAALALGLWAANLSSDLDTTKAELASTKTELASTQTELAAEKQKAQKKAIAGNVLAVAVGAGVAALQDQLGLTPVPGGTAEQELAAAQQRADDAAQALTDAGSPAAKALARAEAASAKSSIAVTCARAAAGVLSSLRDMSADVRARLTAAVDDLKALRPQCKAAFAAG